MGELRQFTLESIFFGIAGIVTSLLVVTCCSASAFLIGELDS